MTVVSGIASAESSLTDAFQQGWHNAGREERLYYRNGPPKVSAPEADDAWLRLDFLATTGNLAGIGERMSDQTGLFIIEGYVPVGIGTKLLNEMLDTAVAILQGQTLGSVLVGAHSYQDVGEDPGGRYYHANLSFPITFQPAPS
jgi:hypothetical protein